MNFTNPFSRQNVIQIRRTNKSSTRKRNLLLNVLIPKNEVFLNRSTLSNELRSPKSSQQESLPNSFLYSENDKKPDLFTNNSLFSKLYNTYSKFSSNPCQFSPEKISENTEFNLKEMKKRVKCSKRLDLLIDKTKPLADPDSSLMQVAPLKPDLIFKHFLRNLTKYEQSEIPDYREIYFIGMNSLKAKVEANEDSSFDDERHNYLVIIGDHIAYRYEVQQILGKGSFGIVCQCYDHKEKKQVALKIVRNEPSFREQARVELDILQYISKNDLEEKSHCIHIKDNFVFRKHLCHTFELLSLNLYEMIKSNNFRGFSLSLVRRFVAQIISALIYLKQHKIIHCDLKPENILLKEHNKSGIKIIDFGSACFAGQKIHTYIQSRFYRAPEVMLGIEYSPAIDMWSLGCIAAELHTGVPLFAGESETEQLYCVMEVKGLPPKDLLEKSTRKKIFFEGENPKFFENSKGKLRLPSSQTLAEKIKSNDQNFLDFISECLEWSPDKRLTPEQAICHEFIQEGLRDFHRNNLKLRFGST